MKIAEIIYLKISEKPLNMEEIILILKAEGVLSEHLIKETVWKLIEERKVFTNRESKLEVDRRKNSFY